MSVASILLMQELSHCYKHMPSESKLDSHIYAIVLLYCLQQSCGTVFSIDGVSISQVVFELLCARAHVCVCVHACMQMQVSISTSSHN